MIHFLFFETGTCVLDCLYEQFINKTFFFPVACCSACFTEMTRVCVYDFDMTKCHILQTHYIPN